MKKIILVFIGLGLFVTAFSQNENKKRPSLGIHYVLNDFNTATQLRSAGLSTVLQTKD